MKKLKSYILPLIAVSLFVMMSCKGNSGNAPYQKNSGFVFGTSYNITYQHSDDLGEAIDSVLHQVDLALSPFNKESVITAINENKNLTTDNQMFTEVFNLASKITHDTDGAFDITVAPLVNAWGFGFKSGTPPTDAAIDSIRSFVGFDKVSLSEGKITKQDPRVMLDCSAIAKGYAVDKVAEMLVSKGVKNLMVEIGGEIVVKGINPKNEAWRIGVTKPVDDSLSTSNELQTILPLTDIAMATSGNYRNFYYKDGKKYAHTIDPATGRPVQHSILSATVLASDCATADAYATSFMVMGLEGTKKVMAQHPEMKAYIIYTDQHGNYCVWSTPNLETPKE